MGLFVVLAATGSALLAAPIVLPWVVRGCLGFGTGGIVAGSAAAMIMASYGGAVAAGSICAILQSIGASGIGIWLSAAIASVGGVLWAGAAAVLHGLF